MYKKIRTKSAPSYEFQKVSLKNKNNIIFHSFFTDKYTGWSRLHFHSINESYGFGSRHILQTMNLNEESNINFNSKDINLYNINIDNKYIAKKLGVSLDKLKILFNKLLIGDLDSESFKLKLFISVQLRYQSLQEIYQHLQESNDFDFLIHSDIDVYHRTNLIEKIDDKDFDIALFGRGFDEKSNEVSAQPLGAYLIFRNSPKLNIFFENWNQAINSLPFKEWSLNYGQISLKNVLIDNIKQKKFKLLDLSKEDNINFSKLSFLKNKNINYDIWLNSNSKFKKDENFSKENRESPNKLSYLTTIQDLSNRIYLKLKKSL